MCSHLVLSGNHLSGTIPSSISKLTALAYVEQVVFILVLSLHVQDLKFLATAISLRRKNLAIKMMVMVVTAWTFAAACSCPAIKLAAPSRLP